MFFPRSYLMYWFSVSQPSAQNIDQWVHVPNMLRGNTVTHREWRCYCFQSSLLTHPRCSLSVSPFFSHSAPVRCVSWRNTSPWTPLPRCRVPTLPALYCVRVRRSTYTGLWVVPVQGWCGRKADGSGVHQGQGFPICPVPGPGEERGGEGGEGLGGQGQAGDPEAPSRRPGEVRVLHTEHGHHLPGELQWLSDCQR